MKKTISLLIVLMMILGTVLLYTGCSGSQTAELNILNWGDYIDPELIERAGSFPTVQKLLLDVLGGQAIHENVRTKYVLNRHTRKVVSAISGRL